MRVVVRPLPSAQSWAAYRGEETVGQVRASIRPDRRCFLFFRDCADDAHELLVAAVTREIRADLFTTVEESDERTQRVLHSLGFVLHRREPVYSIPTDPAVTGLGSVQRPDGITFISAAEADEPRLMSLDDALRQDVPGTDGWRWPEAADFREETLSDAYNPATYLVAVEASSGDYIGLARIWWRRMSPRLGLIAVLPAHRRRGIARALIAEVLAVAHTCGQSDVVTEVDDTNVASRSLLRSIGARSIPHHVHLELRRPGATARM